MPEQAPDGSIVITPKEFYDGVRQDIGDINSTLQNLSQELSGLPSRVDKLEVLVEQLKTKQTWMVGFAAGLSAAATSIATKLLS